MFLTRLDSDEFQLQHEHHFLDDLITLNEQIQVLIDDFKNFRSKFSERSDQQDHRKLNSLSFMRKDVCVHHSMTAQNLQKIFRVQERLVDFTVVQIVFFDQ
jgi:chlorite dismutase